MRVPLYVLLFGFSKFPFVFSLYNVTIPNTDPSVSFVGTSWGELQSLCAVGNTRYTSRQGDFVIFEFIGTAVYAFASADYNSNSGTIIILDGNTFNVTFPVRREPADCQLLFSRTWLSYSLHILMIVKSGSSPNSETLHLDYFVVSRPGEPVSPENSSATDTPGSSEPSQDVKGRDGPDGWNKGDIISLALGLGFGLPAFLFAAYTCWFQWNSGRRARLMRHGQEAA